MTTFRANVTFARHAVRALAATTALVATALIPVTSAGAAPANDNFASATTLAGTSGSFSGTTVGATLQTNEPAYIFDTGTSTIWYKWTAATTGMFRLRWECGSKVSFVTVLESAVAANAGDYRTLTYCAQSSIGGGNAGDVRFLVQAGVSYWIRFESGIDEFGDERGPITGTYSFSSVTDNAFEAIAPTRLLDTRSGSSVGPGATKTLKVAGVNGIPSTAKAVVLNVTATRTTAGGYLTAYPEGSSKPVASNINWTTGATVPSMIIATVGTSGNIKLYNSDGNTHMVVDAMGYFAPSATNGIEMLAAPTRLLDTRTGNGLSGKFTAGQRRDLQITGRGGIPATARAVVINLTSTSSDTGGFITAWPTGIAQPNASVLNRKTGDTVANLAIVPIGSGGKISLYNSTGTTHLIGDVVGYMTPASAERYVAVTPQRMMDTRNYLGSGASLPMYPDTIDYVEGTTGAFNSAPAGASFGVTNLTGVYPTSRTYLTVWGADPQPTTSNLNLAAGVNRANSVIFRPDEQWIQIYNQAGITHFIVDLSGYFWDRNGYLPAARGSATSSPTLDMEQLRVASERAIAKAAAGRG